MIPNIAFQELIPGTIICLLRITRLNIKPEHLKKLLKIYSSALVLLGTKVQLWQCWWILVCLCIFIIFMLINTLWCSFRSCDRTKGSSIKYVRKIFRKTNISNPLIRTRTCAYQGVRNVSFLENFAYVLNGWLLNTYKTLWLITLPYLLLHRLKPWVCDTVFLCCSYLAWFTCFQRLAYFGDFSLFTILLY